MDGIMTMDPLSHFEFFTRALLLLVIFLLRQLPSRYAIQIDSAQFLNSMSMSDDNGVVRGRPWHLAPTGRLDTIDLDGVQDARARARDHFINHYYPHVARGIPSVSNAFPLPGNSAPGRPRPTKPAVQTNTRKRALSNAAPSSAGKSTF